MTVGMSTTDPWILLGFALGVPAAATLFVFLLTRHARRGQRRHTRVRAGEMFRLLGGNVAGRVPERTLRRAAARTDSLPFWDALEAVTATLRVRERRGLAHALAKSGHVAQERRVLAASEPPARHELAARRLGMLPDPRSRRVLRHALVRGPESVRLAAARSLARHRDLKALRWLLEHPGSLGTRPLQAIVGLLRSFGPAARAMLITALERGEADARMECAALDLLGMARCLSARGSITTRLTSPHLELRVAATRALGRLGMGEAIPALLTALEDEAWPVRAMAAQALGRLSASPAVEALAACVSDRSWWVRHHAAYALASIGGDGHDALCDLAARAEDRYAREMAQEALQFGAKARRA